jgi:hypothetical protein
VKTMVRLELIGWPVTLTIEPLITVAGMTRSRSSRPAAIQSVAGIRGGHVAALRCHWSRCIFPNISKYPVLRHSFGSHYARTVGIDRPRLSAHAHQGYRRAGCDWSDQGPPRPSPASANEAAGDGVHLGRRLWTCAKCPLPAVLYTEI